MSGVTPPLDAEGIVEVLNRHGVEYVVVGGVGARLHGASRMTYDVTSKEAVDRPKDREVSP